MAAPSCNSKEYKLTSLDGITPATEYLGDASKANWVSSGTPLMAPDNSSIILTLSEDGASSSGTLLASASYVWYGKISATMKSSRGAGVVSAFILLSDVKDEIDFEFVGADLSSAQSNYYFQGITDCEPSQAIPQTMLISLDENELNISVSKGDTFSQYHTYEIDWQPDSITWSVDGNVSRTLQKSSTFNKTDNQYHYPQTPARVQLSLWPAGIQKNGAGTVAWSGGSIDWNSQDVKANGYFYSMFKDVSIQCYDPPNGANVSGKASYIYTNTAGTNSSIAETNDATVLKSLLGTGTDMNKDYPNSKPSGTQSAGPQQTSNVATIPGLTGAGPGTDGSRGGNGNGGNSGSAPGSGNNGASSSSANAPASTGIGGFSQGAQKGSAAKGEEVTRGSMLAVLIAFIGMLSI